MFCYNSSNDYVNAVVEGERVWKGTARMSTGLLGPADAKGDMVYLIGEHDVRYSGSYQVIDSDFS